MPDAVEEPQGARAMDCRAAGELLSDYLDIRRGERPVPGMSPLADAHTLESLKRHLGACKNCEGALTEIEEIGLAFSEQPVSAPSEIYFAGYAQTVRARVHAQARSEAPARQPVIVQPSWWTWPAITLASAAAALLAVSIYIPREPKAPVEKIAVAQASDPKEVLPAAKPVVAQVDGGEMTPFPMVDLQSPTERWVRTPFTLVDLTRPNSARSVTFDPERAQANEFLGQLARELRQNDCCAFWETPLKQGAREFLLGVSLRRVETKDLPNEGPDGLAVHWVEPGSPAERMGLQRGDIILAINRVPFNHHEASEPFKFLNAVYQLGKGAMAQVEYARLSGRDWVIRRGVGVLGGGYD